MLVEGVIIFLASSSPNTVKDTIDEKKSMGTKRTRILK